MKQVDPLIVPRGLSRSQAAAYVGIGTTLFDRLVATGVMPQPREIGSPWDAILGEAPPTEDTLAYTGDDDGYLPNAYTPASLAKRWKCSPRHIRNMVKRGDLEAIALGGKLLRITRDVVEAYEDRRDGAA